MEENDRDKKRNTMNITFKDSECNKTKRSSQTEGKESLKRIIKRKKHRLLPDIKKENEILLTIRSRVQDYGGIFLTTKQRIKYDKFKRPKKVPAVGEKEDIKGVKEINNYNVFDDEDKMIKGLMKEFYNKSLKQKPPLERRKLALNKLYDITPEITERLDRARHKKYVSLGAYQANILNAINNKDTLSRRKMIDLEQEFNELRIEVESVRPLPKINVDIIYDHVYHQPDKKSLKKMSVRDILNHKNVPKDEFEKEEKLINSIKNFKLVPKKKRNRTLDNMPLYIRKLFAKGIN